MVKNFEELALEIKGLNFSYPNNKDRIFKDFNLRIPNNSIVAILGPSGCGKTTLLNLLCAVIGSDNYRFHFSCDSEQIGYFFQEYPFLPRKTTLAHVEFPMLIRGIQNSRAIAESWLTRTDLLDHIGKRVSSLSTGMKARVALATTMAWKPKILLLDEPFRSLDIETKFRMWKLLKEAHQFEPFAALLVTHDILEALLLADEIIVLSRPPVRMVLRLTNTLRDYKDPFALFGDSTATELQKQIWEALSKAMKVQHATI